jgi:hypothetical protein
MPDQQKLNEEGIRIGILRILEHQRKHSDNQPGGASGLLLMELLGIQDVLEIESALKWLKDNRHIEIGERKFLITARGTEYLAHYLT